MYVVFCKIDHCIHIHWCIVMGLGHNDPWVESHMWPQQTWGQRSSRGQWPLVQVFGKKCIHILWCIFKSNITMIAKVCDRESRRDTCFENRLVSKTVSFGQNLTSPVCYLWNSLSGNVYLYYFYKFVKKLCYKITNPWLLIWSILRRILKWGPPGCSLKMPKRDV